MSLYDNIMFFPVVRENKEFTLFGALFDTSKVDDDNRISDWAKPSVYFAAANGIIAGTGKAKTIPIVAMTANVFSDDIDRCLKVGMNDHIGKPLDLDIVMEVLKRYFGN